MNDSRAASIFPDDLETLEAAGELLFRYHENTAGIRLLAIALRLRGQTGIRQAGVDFKITGYSGFTDPPVAVVPGEFGCSVEDIDESAGMAEVVELNGYSRKVLPGCGA